MKKAFTMLELIFVIVVIGILTSVIIPRTQTNSLEQAANQVIEHIRYTQHLAMVDDIYESNNIQWYKKRWEIKFGKSKNTNYKMAYSIFSDHINKKGNYDGKPNFSELAINPNNLGAYLSGGYSGGLKTNDKKNRSNKKMNIGEYYSIKNILFSGGCSKNRYFLYFDYLGRPFNSINKNNSYEKDKLLTNDCKISLCIEECTGESSINELVINISKETGYVCILNMDGVCRK